MRVRLNLCRWLRARAVVLAGLGLLAAQAAWTADLLAHSYFRQDMNPAFFSPGQGSTSQVIGALAGPARADRWTLTLDGVIAGPMTFDDRGQLRPVTVLGPASFGGTPNQVSLPSGRHVVYVPVVGDGSTVTLQFAGRTPGALCVTGVTVGSLHPEPAGRAIPAAPVPG